MAGETSVVFVGALTLDAIAVVEAFPHPDSRQVARDIVYAGGGPAATAAVAAARLGVPAAMIGAVGEDEEGQRIISALRQEGVDVSAVQVAGGQRSGASVIVVDAHLGTRAIATRPVPAPTLPSTGPAAALLDQAQWVHADHLGWQPVHDYFAGLPPARRPRLSVDGGNPITGFTPAGVDLYVPTVEALVRRYGDVPIDQLLEAALGEGAEAVVATRGAHGSVMATRAGQRHTAPGHATEVISTLGAGDVFHGALVAAVVQGLAPADRLAYANITAALSCRGVDGRSAIPTDREVRDVLGADRAHHPTPAPEEVR